MNMREKIAIAISGAPFPSKASLRKADAVLDALMEPTEGMLEAAGGVGAMNLKRSVFVSAIRAAKEGK